MSVALALFDVRHAQGRAPQAVVEPVGLGIVEGRVEEAVDLCNPTSQRTRQFRHADAERGRGRNGERRTSLTLILSPVPPSHSLTSFPLTNPSLCSSKHANASSISCSGERGDRCDARRVTKVVKLIGSGEDAEGVEESGWAWRRSRISCGEGCWPAGRERACKKRFGIARRREGSETNRAKRASRAGPPLR